MTGEIPKPDRQLDAHDLRNYLDSFIRQNKNSRSIEHRWLAAYASDLFVQASNVRNGFRDTIKAAVEAFRLNEIGEARRELAKQDKVLETEAAKIEAARGA